MDNLKLRHAKELRLKRKMIKELSFEKATIQRTAESNEMERACVERKYQKLKEFLDELDAKIGAEKKFEELNKRLLRSRSDMDAQADRNRELKTLRADLQARLDQARATSSAAREERDTAEISLEMASGQCEDLRRSIEKEEEAAKRDLVDLQTRIEEDKRIIRAETGDTLRRKDMELTAIRGHLESTQRAAEKTEEAAKEEVRLHEVLQKELRAEKNELIDRHEKAITEERRVTQVRIGSVWCLCPCSILFLPL